MEAVNLKLDSENCQKTTKQQQQGDENRGERMGVKRRNEAERETLCLQ